MKIGRENRGKLGAATIAALLPGVFAALALAAIVAALASLGGCVGTGLTGTEVELIDASAADARFVDRNWSQLDEAERRTFIGENALRWSYFSNLVHGTPPQAVAARK